MTIPSGSTSTRCGRILGGEAYWGRWRTRDDVEHEVAAAWRVVGVYTGQGEMVGFARAVSDGSNLGYLADVYVLRDHRGQGLGEALVREMIDNGPGARFRWLLHTADAHGLYRKFGFEDPGPTLMERLSTRSLTGLAARLRGPRRPTAPDDEDVRSREIRRTGTPRRADLEGVDDGRPSPARSPPRRNRRPSSGPRRLRRRGTPSPRGRAPGSSPGGRRAATRESAPSARRPR